MIKKVVHLADIHIRKSLRRHQEYKLVLQRTIDSIKKQNPDRIVIVGDIYHDFIDIEGEALVIATWFLKELAKICQVVVTRGNHDFMKKNKKRYDVVKTITEMINEPNIVYYEETGFYEDDNIVWAVWHHPDKQGPWKTVNHKRDSKKTYVDLFHDPVKSCMTPLGWPLEKGVHITIDDFEGDLGMFGDIHLQQNMDDDGKKAYSGSLIQQSFDEKIHGHGYLLWDIEKQTYDLIEVENDWRHIEIVLDGEIDYDDLNIELEETFPHMYFKVKWTDVRSNIHRINQSKIREHLKKYNPLDIKWDKTVLKNSEMEVDDEIRKNINDPEVQRKVFKDYLKEIGYEDEKIEQILDIDRLISDRLPNRENDFSEYQVEAVWIDNFKSYGDDLLINWKDNNGIIQITGENQAGKTTLLDAICYVLFGKTLSTLKKQKHGDNRYINNKRDLNHCSAWVVLKINEKRLLLKRSTGRKMHKTENRVTSVTTEFFIYDLSDLNIEEISKDTIEELDVNDALTGERYLDTQKEIEKSVGTFEDFIRVVMINADNLNDLLSIDRASFIDAVMRYAGYTIFEDKLDEFKEYKKEEAKKIDKIVLDLDFENDRLEHLEKEVEGLKDTIKDSEEYIKKEKASKEVLNEEKEELLRDLINVSEEILEFDPEKAKSSIESLRGEIDSRRESIRDLEVLKDNLATEEQIKEAKDQISKYEDKIEECTSKKESLNEELVDFNSQKKDEEAKITLEEKERDSKIDALKNEIKHKISENSVKTDSLFNEIKYIIDSAKDLNKSISDLENSKTCSQCGQELKEDAMAKIKESIDAEKAKLKDLKQKHQSKSEELDKLKQHGTYLEKSLSDIDGSAEKIKIESEFDNKVSLINESINSILDKAKAKKEEIDEEVRMIEASKITISNNKQITEDASKRVEADQHINKHNLKIGEYTLEIKSLESNQKLYEANQKSLEHNQRVNEKISEVNSKIEDSDSRLDSLNRELSQAQTDLSLKEEDIKAKKERIEKYAEQVAREELMKIYQKCVHRDGIPTMLLKRSVDVINDEMASVLQDQDYVCYFDEDLNLLMSSLNKLSSNQNAIESSGKERTFIALALKLALRSINNTSRPNLILLDEMTGKLINESVEQFFEMLNRIKESIDKIIIIEHNHPINYDWRIHVEKDEKEISKCELI
jgi:DNA repair exonuclease SbcCD ATPase subunit